MSDYAIIGIVLLIVVGLALLAAAFGRPCVKKDAEDAAMAWSSYRIGFTIYALIFLSFDMEMIFMYPWAVVFAEQGLKAFLDMLVFIGLLSAGISYAWGMGGFKWE